MKRLIEKMQSFYVTVGTIVIIAVAMICSAVNRKFDQ